MEEQQASLSNPIEFLRQNSDVIADEISQYGYIVVDSLYFIVLGMLAVFLLHKLASRFLYPYLQNTRLVRVVFGTLYVLVLVVTVLIALKRAGLETGGMGQVLVLLVLFAAVLVYFLIPFLPKLPFMPGHMIETSGVTGIVDSISSFHTTLRKFDGTIVFLPNALVMASRIQNFSYTPTRRVEIKLLLSHDTDIEAARGRVLDAFTYQGWFAINMAGGAREVIALDGSAPALAVLERNLALNGFDADAQADGERSR